MFRSRNKHPKHKKLSRRRGLQSSRTRWQYLRGLMYFTDGFGTYPEKPTAYDTAFVFCTDQRYDDSGVPDWAMKLYI